jgi:hypothetical protein
VLFRSEIFLTCPDRSWGHPASCTMGTWSFLGVKCGWGVKLTPHPFLVPWSRKGRAIPLLPLWAVRPVQGCTLPYSRAIPLLPLWAVRPVQRCTLPYSRAIPLLSYRPYGLYRASVLVQGCTLPYSRAIPLLHLWAVRPVQSFSACTTAHFTLQ